MEVDPVYVICPIKQCLIRGKSLKPYNDKDQEILQTLLGDEDCQQCTGYDTVCKTKLTPVGQVYYCTKKKIKMRVWDVEKTVNSVIPEVGAWDREYKTSSVVVYYIEFSTKQ